MIDQGWVRTQDLPIPRQLYYWRGYQALIFGMPQKILF